LDIFGQTDIKASILCVQYTFTGASHPFKSKGRAYLPALCLEFYHLFRWENALIIKPWNGFFTSFFFFVQSSYDGENSFFFLHFVSFISAHFIFFLYFGSCKFPVKNFYKLPVDDTMWTWSLGLLQTKIPYFHQHLAWCGWNYFFPLFFYNACA